MTDVRYVCLSDMHLGEEDSLLTNLQTAKSNTDPLSPSPVMVELAQCLEFLLAENKGGDKPTLILNGDILELALTTTNEAAMVFEQFITLVMAPGKEFFDDIIYVPGNHDHHQWEIARESQYAKHIQKIKTGTELPVPYHATSMFVENKTRPPAYFLNKLIQRHKHLKDFKITIAYPNYGLLRDDDKKCVIFHHGHYIESLYHLMTTLQCMIFPDQKPPEQVWDIEAENFAWIDFFWSSMGRSGQAGQDVELIYEKMQDREEFKKLLHNLATSLAKKYDLPGWGDAMEAQFLKWTFDYLVDRFMGTERAHVDKDLSNGAETGLRSYMNGPLIAQNKKERDGKEMPEDVTFVFGHTHKPFSRDMSLKGYSNWVNVYNTGGWVVETVDPQPLHGGAMVLIDDDLNTASVRLYNEQIGHEKYSVRVEEAMRAGQKPNPLHKRLDKLINHDKEPWKNFSAAVADSVHVRERHLQARITEKD